MKKQIKSNSLIILARSHNPTLVSDHFLLSSGIISDVKEINPNNKIITPAITQIQLLSGTQITLDQDRLNITSPEGKEPYTLGEKYCKSLSFIRATAIGINYDIVITDFDFKKWFDRVRVSDLTPNQFKFARSFKNKIANITVSRDTDISANFQFNFHYPVEDKTLGQLGMKFVYEWEENKKYLDMIIKTLLK